MAAFTSVIPSYIFVLVLFSSLSNSLSEECVKKSACLCEFSNGTGIDLTPLSATLLPMSTSTSINETSYIMSTYYFHPCTDDGLLPQCNANPSTKSSLCRIKVNMTQVPTNNTLFLKQTDGYEGLGNTLSTVFATDPKSNSISLVVQNGPSATSQVKNTTIHLICAPNSAATLGPVNLDDDKELFLSLTGREACLKEIEPISYRSTGSTLLILFFTFVIFYLVLGVCTKKFLMGAQGLEVVPNLAFWLALPGLVKDGWLFIINGFKVTPSATAAGPAGPRSPDPNSYDSI